MRPRTDHTCQVHEPGARACYGTHSCRCRACTDAATRWQRHYNHARAHGARLTVDATPIAQHVARLLAVGMTQDDIAEAAGVTRGTVRNIRRGRVQRVSHVTAGRLLAVKPRSAGGHAEVSARGTARRLQSLACMGWDCETLAPIVGYSATFLRHLRAEMRPTVHAATRDHVHAVWDRLALVPHVGATAGRARMFAARHGWAPPLAWDDDTIDNPDARPHPARDDTPRHGLSGRRARFDLDDLAFLADAGLTVAQAADRLGVTKSTIEHRCERADRRDLLAQLQRNKEAS